MTAICLTYMARGVPMGWLDGLVDDTPREVRCETGGGGDDIRLTLSNGERVEIQVKKGLTAGASLQDALAGLATALSDGSIAFGILAVCPFSSRTIGKTLAGDIVRLGEDPLAEIDPLADSFRKTLISAGMDVGSVCSRLRIVNVAALDSQAAHVAAARAELAHLCSKPDQARAAWNALYRDATGMIATRGIRHVAGVAAVLGSAGVDLVTEGGVGSAALAARLCDWTARCNDSFSILGVAHPLPIDTAWRSLSLTVRPGEVEAASDPMSALDAYHGWSHRRRGGRDDTCDADAVGRFFRHAVIIAGPGMGKSTLLRRLARHYAQDGYPVLLVRAKAVAAAMKAGSSFEAAVFDLGLDGSTLQPAVLKAAPIDDWVLLFDGLDEAGASQATVSQALRQFQAGRPGARIITTSRPIGYQPSPLSDWRHYEIRGAGRDDIPRALDRLLTHIRTREGKPPGPEGEAEARLEDTGLRDVVAQSALMLGIAAALISRGHDLGQSRIGLFRAIFDLVQAEPPERAGPPPSSVEVLNRVLDLLGVQILDDPLKSKDAMIAAIGDGLAADLGVATLQARTTARECLDYWEAIGLVETVSHDHQSLLTTTHLTFAEFAAGRYIAGLPAEDMTVATAGRAALPRWSEGLWFAAAEGAGDLVLERLLATGVAGRSGDDVLKRCLDIVASSRTSLRRDLVDRVLSAAKDDMASDDVALACEVALKALHLCSLYPDRMIGVGVELLNGGHLWSRLAGWTLVVKSGRSQFDLAAAQAALSEVVDALEERRDGSGGSFVSIRPENELARVFATMVFDALLTERPIEEADVFIAPLLEKKALNTAGFWRDIAVVLQARGSKVNPFADFKGLSGNLNLNGFEDRARRAWTVMIAGLIPPGRTLENEDRARPGRSLFHMSAISHYCRWGDNAPKDIWVWNADLDPRGPAAALQAIVTIGGLDPDAVAREALFLQKDLNENQTSALSAFFGRFATLDIAEIDLERADRKDLDVEGLRLALFHPSEMIVPTATAVLDEVLTLDERRQTVRALLDSPKVLQVWAGAALVGKLPREEAVSVIRRGLSAGATGLAQRLEALAELGVTCAPALFAALRPILFGPDADDAVEVAKYLKAAGILDPDVLSGIRDAEAHWRDREQPPPEKAGAVPSNPRSHLLEIRVAQRDASLDELFEGALDQRSGARDVAQTALEGIIGSDEGAREVFIDRALSGALATTVMTKVFLADVAWSETDQAALEPLFTSPLRSIRLAAINLLEGVRVSPARRTRLLTALRGDVEPALRSRAAVLMKQSDPHVVP